MTEPQLDDMQQLDGADEDNQDGFPNDQQEDGGAPNEENMHDPNNDEGNFNDEDNGGFMHGSPDDLNPGDQLQQGDEEFLENPNNDSAAGRNGQDGEGKSKELLDAFFARYTGEVQQQFREFAQPMGETQEIEDSIVARDVPLVLRVSFYHDNITFHATPTEKTELFNKPNSYKFIIDNLSGYFQREIDPNIARVSFHDFVQFVYFFVLRNPEGVFLRQDGANNSNPAMDEVTVSPLQRELMDNIEKYEQILQNPSISQQERIIAQKTIDSLKAQLKALMAAAAAGQEGEKSKRKTKTVPKNEQRLKNLKEAFEFYTKQQVVSGSKFTFDRIVHEHNVVSLACFLLMLKQYNILNANKHVTKREVLVMFKKYALNHKEVDFDTFQIMIEKVAMAYYRDEDGVNGIDAVEKFYTFLQVDNAVAFRAKRTLLNQPFNIQMKDGFRLLPFDQGREIPLKKIDPIIKEKLKQRKEEKLTFSIANNASRFGDHSKSTPSLLLQSKESSIQQPYIFAPSPQQNYTAKKGKSSVTKLEQQQKISWQQLERLSFTDMKNLNRGLFKPSDLFNDNDDDEDRIYLAEYNLEADRRKKIEQTLSNKKGQENYGQIKQTLRPSQRYLQKQDMSLNAGDPTSVKNSNNYNGSSEYYSPQIKSINSKYSARAVQIDKDQRSKERNLMQSIINNNDLKIQRGIQAVNRLK